MVHSTAARPINTTPLAIHVATNPDRAARVQAKWREQALYQNTADIFNLGLSRLERVVVTSVPR